MRPFISLIIALILCGAGLIRAEDADDLRAKGIAALKESQANPRAIVDAARFFVKAAELYGSAGDESKNVEMNSFLYWCKKKMSMQDIDAYTKGGEAAVSSKLAAVEKLAPKAGEAQPWFDRAEQFAAQNPDEHLLIAIRFYEVADRFKGSDSGMKALDRSLKEQLQDKSTAAKPMLPPAAVAAPKSAPTTGGSQPVPAAEKIKDAEKTIKDLFKAEYAQTDAPGRLALAAKLLQQADENKGDAASEYVLLRDARDLAVAAGDVAQATAAQKRLRDAFSLDFAAILADLKHLEATAKTEASASALATLFSAAADDALEADNFEQVVRFNSHIDDLLPLIKDAVLKTRFKLEIASAQALKRDSVPALAALKILATKLDDPEANLAAGKFALERGKFEAAFALLAKGKDAALSGVAKSELAPPTEAAEQVKLGDGWFERAEKEAYNNLKVPMQERAAVWYGNALPALAGLTKLKVEGRLKVLASPGTELTLTSATNGVLNRELVLAIGNGINLELILIPAGAFQMGSPESEQSHRVDEALHAVTISNAFYMGKYPVTQEQYEAVTGRTPSKFTGPKNPVEQVSWDEAIDFCKMLNSKLRPRLPKGMELRLPTEAQREYACRAGSKTRYYSGDADDDMRSVAWAGANSQGQTHPVGLKTKNAFGLYDINGNIWEWCQDAYNERYEKLESVDPFEAQGAERVTRGGCYNSNTEDHRSAFRHHHPPDFKRETTGFRVVVSMPLKNAQK